MAPLLDLRRLENPIVQAGMGAVARHELAAAVSEAGALVIITFWGRPRRLASKPWIHQCGSPTEAKAAVAAGADAVIAQGIGAGGHVRGTTPMLELVEQLCSAVSVPVFAAGGIVDRTRVHAALDAGAVAAVVGTRFLVSEESHAHPGYKRRCVEAETTVVTELFGLGWPGAPHHVIPNAATRLAARSVGDATMDPGGKPPNDANRRPPAIPAHGSSAQVSASHTTIPESSTTH